MLVTRGRFLAGDKWQLWIRSSQWQPPSGNDRIRRYLAVAARSGEGPFTHPFRSLRGPAGPFQMGRERDEGASLPIEPHVLKTLLTTRLRPLTRGRQQVAPRPSCSAAMARRRYAHHRKPIR
jgi:hypothetical protein